jgi:LmbE family N-acetylglucosaminyl deacetylase
MTISLGLPHRAARNRPSTGPSMPVAGVGNLFGIWAHPDDEAYASAALMSLVRGAGNRVTVATATHGEHGTPDPDAWPPQRLAALRERELAASLAACDVREHHWLGYRDGTLEQVPTDRAVRQVAELIDAVRPETIVTFGPDGLTGHTDHQTVSGWVTAAWNTLGRPGRLWYVTLTDDFHRSWADVNASVGLWMPGAVPPSEPASELAFALHSDDTLLDRKLVALRAHASQTSHLISELGVDRYRRWWATEAFVSADRDTATGRVAA